MREEVESRPIVAVLIGLIIGLVALELPASLLFLGLFVLVFRPLRCRLLLACAFVVGLLVAPGLANPIVEATPVHAIGTISSVPKLHPGLQTFDVQTDGRIIEVSTEDRAIFALGDDIRVSGIEMPLTPEVEAYAASMGIDGRIRSERIEVVRVGSWFAHLSGEWREAFVVFFDKAMSGESAALVDAVCFNGGPMLGSSKELELKRSGLIHIVTASGLQVFVLAFLLSSALRFLPITRGIQIALLAMLLGSYAMAAGLNPAIVRATIITLLGLGAYLFRREQDSLSALGVAGIGYLLWNPHSIYNAGFQLSFITMACLVLFFKRSPIELNESKGQLIRLSNDLLRLSFVVLLASMPLSAYYFGGVSTVSILSNALVCWCTPLVIAGSFVTFVVSWVMPAVATSIAAHVLSPLCEWMLSVLAWTGGEGSTLSISPFSGYWLVAFYGAWLLTYRRRVVQP
jgi:competence protein ComEC